MKGRAAHLRILVAVLATLSLYPSASASEQAPVETIEIVARPITQFHIGHDEKRFGPFEFVGGLEVTARSRNFGGLSAIRFLKPGAEFIGVADTGFWFFGTVAHGGDGRPSGILNFTMQQMVDAAGRPIDKKRDADAESLAVKDGIATVGFEHNHRIAQFRIDPADMASPLRKLDFLIPARELRQNKGFETIAVANEGGPLKGSLVAVSERSLDTAGNVYAATLEGPGKGVFTVRRDGEFDITDGAFLPNGDLLLLERSFSIMGGVKMRLRRIQGGSIAKGAIADGPVLLQADMSYQIDNMEGLDVWTHADGALMVSLISDDNHSILQRNLYLEFILHED